MEPSARIFTVSPEDDGVRLDRWVKRNLPDLSFNIVSRWARTGQIRVNGRRVEPGDHLETGQTIRMPPAEAAPPVPAARAPRPRAPLSEEERDHVRGMVILETPSAFVLNKPPGLATQGGTRTNEHLDRLLDGLVEDGATRPRLVHRLDKDTSGVILVAKTSNAAAFFSKRFSGRDARKIYWALVVGEPAPPQGEVDLPLAKQPGTGGEKMHVDPEGGLPSRTRYRTLDHAGARAAWLELQPLTGRTHQLRAHCTALGHPIVGDGKYGGAEAFLTGGISRKMHLHARRLRIDVPEGGKIDVAAPLPRHFLESMELLGFEEATGDYVPPPPAPAEIAAAAKRKAGHQARDKRRARRGERRGRGRAE